jgi:ketosteroid isomerase-like protein
LQTSAKIRRRRLAGAAALLLCALLAAACESPKAARLRADKAEVEARLQHYSALMLAMDSPGIAAMFAQDGEMVNPSRPPIRGPAAIEKYLSGFSDFHVLSNVDEPLSIVIDGDSALQTGTYRQSVRSPQGKVFETSGRFEIAWVRDSSGEWLLSQVATFPSK